MSTKKQHRDYWKERDKKNWLEKLLCWIFAHAWSHRLKDEDDGRPPYQVLRVRGWRTALVARRYYNKQGNACECSRQCVTFCFWIFK